MAKKEKAAALDGDEKPAGKSKLKLIIIIVVVVLLAVGLSVGGTLFFLGKKDDAPAEAKSEAPAAPVKQLAIYENVAPAFVVNISHAGRQRYMQVSVALMARDQAKLDALKVHLPLLRNQLNMLFASQNFDSLMTPVGKEMLRQQATTTVQELAKKEVGDGVVEQVLFTNFVLQ